jgi:hypothetical protein
VVRTTRAAATAKRAFARAAVAGTCPSKARQEVEMATQKQVQAAKRNIGQAQRAARSKRTIAHLPAETRRDMGRQAAKARSRGGKAGQGYEDRTRRQLYEVAKQRGIAGRSKMGKWELIDALRRS